jgi:hypothetical protein
MYPSLIIESVQTCPRSSTRPTPRSPRVTLSSQPPRPTAKLSGSLPKPLSRRPLGSRPVSNITLFGSASGPSPPTSTSTSTSSRYQPTHVVDCSGTPGATTKNHTIGSRNPTYPHASRSSRLDNMTVPLHGAIDPGLPSVTGERNKHLEKNTVARFSPHSTPLFGTTIDRLLK